MNRSFQLELIDQKNLDAYCRYFGFSRGAGVPLSFLYLIAQRAQIALLLEEDFPLPLPGMVHFDNILESRATFDPAAPLSLEVRVFVEAKKEGSLFPVMEVDFIQKGQTVAHCRSGYFVRRKSSGPKKKREQEAPFPNELEELWHIPVRTGWEYARISGDFNPIHWSTLFAKATGLPGRIIHGWYSVSRVVARLERERTKPANRITVQFKKPVRIPGEVVFGSSSSGDGHNVQLHSDDQQTLFLSGYIQ